MSIILHKAVTILAWVATAGALLSLGAFTVWRWQYWVVTLALLVIQISSFERGRRN